MPTYEYECGTCGNLRAVPADHRGSALRLSALRQRGAAADIERDRHHLQGIRVLLDRLARLRQAGDDAAGNGKETSKADGDSAGKDSSAGESKSDSKSDATSDTSTKTKKKEPAAATAAKD